MKIQSGNKVCSICPLPQKHTPDSPLEALGCPICHGFAQPFANLHSTAPVSVSHPQQFLQVLPPAAISGSGTNPGFYYSGTRPGLLASHE